MEWSEGDNWYLEVDLFPGVTDFKCAVVRQDGSVAAWEPGANRTVEASTPAIPLGCRHQHHCLLCNPRTTWLCCLLLARACCTAWFVCKQTLISMQTYGTGHVLEFATIKADVITRSIRFLLFFGFSVCPNA